MTTTCTHDVAVIGCGLMGAALARALADTGHYVAVWNRSPERAAALVGERIEAFASAVDAVASAPLVIACTSSNATTRASLDSVTDWTGRTLVNLGTSTPGDAIELSEWAAERGASYLDGALLTFPEFVGSPDALVAFSGSREVWAEHEKTLMCLGGRSRHVSENVGAASVLDTAIIGSFYVTSTLAYVEAASYAQAQGVSPEMLRETTKLVLRTLGHSTKEAAAAIASGDFTTEQATLATYADGSRSTLTAMRAAGYHARLLEAAVSALEDARNAGLGDLGIYAQALASRVGDAPGEPSPTWANPPAAEPSGSSEKDTIQP